MMRGTCAPALALCVVACASIAQPEAPARIVEPDADSRAELRAAVVRALQRVDVTLADDALTRSHMLLIERAPARNPTGQRVTGRDYERPEQFQLVVSGKRCTLIHQRTGERYDLALTRCEAEDG
jgi:hypothetical protein